MEKHNYKYKKGFTLVELLIVIVIISILFIVLIAKVDFTSNEARATGIQADLRAYSAAANSAALEYFGFSDDVTVLAEQLNKFLDAELQVYVDGNNLETKALDSWGKPYIITNMNPDGTRGEVSFISAGPDMEYFTEDDQIVRVLCDKNGNVDVSYPMQQAHTHKFEENEIHTALKSPATCQAPAVYYFSCIVCKMNSQDIFEVGGIDPNNHTTSEKTYVMNDENSHTVESYCECGGLVSTKSEQHTFNDGACAYCSQTEHAHTYTQEVVKPIYASTSATCTVRATYYHSCTCGQMGHTTFEVGSMLEHDFTAEIVRPDLLASEGTCIVRAQYYKTCTVCGAKGEETFEAGTLVPHIYNQESILPGFLASNATCTTKAKYYYSCTCGTRGHETFEYGDVGGHNYSASSCTEPPTCIYCGHESGTPTGHNPVFVGSQLVHQQCSNCETVLSATHSYTSEVVNGATCTENGTTKYTCECGYFYTDKNLIASGHTYDQQVIDIQYLKITATCTTKAEYYYSCSCGAKGTESFEYGEANGHQYSAATCTAAQVCSICGYTSGEPLGHTPTAVGDQGTCSKCIVCNTILSSSHTYETSISHAATCIEKGTTKYTCSCGYYYELQNIEKNPDNHAGSIVNGNSEMVHSKYSCCGVKVSGEHDYTESVHSPATCTVKGVTKYTCTCGYSHTLQNIPEDSSQHYGTAVNAGTADVHQKYSCCGATASTEHNYTKTTESNATCVLKGTSKYTCTCGYSYIAQDIPATGHHYDQQVATDKYFISEATCTVPAKYYYSCICGAQSNEIFDYGTANGHDYSDATCTTSKVCATCGHVDGDALGHTPVMAGTAQVHSQCSVCLLALSTEHAYEETTVNTATCTAKGSTKYTCDCGYTYTLEDVEKDPDNHTGEIVTVGTAGVHSKWSCCNLTEESEHTMEETILVPAKCNAKGTTKYSCSCGYFYTSQNITENPNNHANNDATNAGRENVHTWWACCELVVSRTHDAETSSNTSTTNGVKTYRCSCGYTTTEVVCTSHYCSNGSYSWSNNCNTCTATGNCDTCGTPLTEIGTRHVRIQQIATCQFGNRNDYYATFTMFGNSGPCYGWHNDDGNKNMENHATAYGCTLVNCQWSLCQQVQHTETKGGTYEVHSKCSVCGTTLSTTHSYTSTIANGIKTFTCTCGYTYGELICTHRFDDGLTILNYDANTSCYQSKSFDISISCSLCGQEFETTIYSTMLYTEDKHCDGRKYVWRIDFTSVPNKIGASTEIFTFDLSELNDMFGRCGTSCNHIDTNSSSKDSSNHRNSPTYTASRDICYQYTCCNVQVYTHTFGEPVRQSMSTDHSIMTVYADCTTCYYRKTVTLSTSTSYYNSTIYCLGKRYEHIATTTEFGGTQTIHCPDWHWDTSSGTSTTHWGSVNASTGKYSCCGAPDPNATAATWIKYSCEPVYGNYDLALGDGYTVGWQHSGASSLTFTLYSSYTFSETTGLKGSGTSKTFTIYNTDTKAYIESLVVGYYHISDPTTAIKITSVSACGYLDTTNQTGIHLTFNFNASQSAQCGKTILEYSKGSTSYGTVTTNNNTVPSGTIVQGSYAEGYVVIKSGYTYYYYELQ